MGEDVLLAEDELLELLLREPVGDVGQVGPVLLANLPRRGEVLHNRRDPHADVANLRVKQSEIFVMFCPRLRESGVQLIYTEESAAKTFECHLVGVVISNQPLVVH